MQALNATRLPITAFGKMLLKALSLPGQTPLQPAVRLTPALSPQVQEKLERQIYPHRAVGTADKDEAVYYEDLVSTWRMFKAACTRFLSPDTATKLPGANAAPRQQLLISLRVVQFRL